METFQESEDDTGLGWFPEEEGGQDLPADELKKSNSEASPRMPQAVWALKCFQTWLNTKKLKIDLKSVSKKELAVVLRQWYGSIRTSRGGQYSLGSYQSLRSGLSRYINDPPISRSWNLIQDPEFGSANIVFKRVSGELKRAGKGRGTSFHPISPEDLPILKQSKALNPDNPLGLLNKVWFDIQLHFGQIGKGGFRDHKPDSFTLKCDECGAKYFTMTLNEETAPLDRDHRRAVMYEEPGSPLCPVLSLKTYLKKIPPKATSLYLKPRSHLNKTDTYWYTSIPMRGKDLLQMLPSICKEAGMCIYTYRHLTATSKQIPPHAGFESREVLTVKGDRVKQLPSRSASSGTKDKMIRLSKSEMRALVEQEIQRTIKENEARLQVLIDTFEQLESGVDYEHSIQKLEARINIVAKKAEAALACIMKAEKKNPPSSLVKVNKDEIERTVPEDKSADSVEKDADVFQLMENTRKVLKKMHSEHQAVKAAIAGLGRTDESPPPVLTPHGSPNFKGHASFIKKELEDTPEKANAQEQIEEPKAKRVKVECVSANQSYSAKAKNIKEEHSYPPLPSIPFPSMLSMEAASYNIPPRPEVQVALIRDPPGLSVLWKLEKEDPCAAPMDSYRVYMTAEKVAGSDDFSGWKIVGEVRAIQLPIGVMIKKYKSGCKTCIAVVGKDIFNRFGPFSKVVSVVIPN